MNDTVSELPKQCMAKTYLQNVVAQLEKDHMLHPEILLDENHALRALQVLVGVRSLVIKTLHNVMLEVLEEEDLGFDVFGVVRYGVVLADIYGALTSRGNIVNVSTKKYVSAG